MRRQKDYWDPKAKLILIIKYNRFSDEELAKMTGKTPDQVRAKLRELNYQRSRPEEAAIRRRLYNEELRVHIKVMRYRLSDTAKLIADHFLKHERLTDRRAEMLGYTPRQIDRILRKELQLCLHLVKETKMYSYYTLQRFDGSQPAFRDQIADPHPCGLPGAISRCQHFRQCYLAGTCSAGRVMLDRYRNEATPVNVFRLKETRGDVEIIAHE